MSLKTLTSVLLCASYHGSFFLETSQNRTISANFLGTVWMVKSTLTPGAAGRNRTCDGGWPFWILLFVYQKHTLFIAAVLPLDHYCIDARSGTWTRDHVLNRQIRKLLCADHTIRMGWYYVLYRWAILAYGLCGQNRTDNLPIAPALYFCRRYA